MKAHQIESTPEEDRDRETVAYPARDEEDLEQILEQAHTVEDEETAEAVENINGVVDDELRGVVRNHFQAPIRSLNNPQENSVELQEEYRSDENTILSNPDAVEAFNKVLKDQKPPKKEAQVVGEEYFVNQNLPGFQDVGNIKWWTVYDDGTYREETRNDRGGEHLNFDRNGELHGFHVELDGEQLGPNEVQRLARNLQTRRDNQVTTRSGPTISELSNIPEMVLEHNNITEAVEASEDYDRENFESEYEEAQELGLVTGKGNLTLKGWLSAVDLEAPDIRSLEDKEDVISFANLEREHIPGEVEEFTEVGNVNLTFTIPEGRYADEERVGDYNAEATVDRTDRYTEFETEDLVEEIIFGRGFGGLSIPDLEDGEVRELNSRDVEKVAEIMENDPFTEEELLNSEYEEKLLDMFDQKNATVENLKVEDSEYRLRTLDEMDEDSEHINWGELLGDTLNDFGYSTPEELIEDAGWDEELNEICENFEKAEAKVDEDSDRRYVDIIFEDEEESTHRTTKEAKQTVFSNCKKMALKAENGELQGEASHKIPVSNLIISSYQDELIENGASIVTDRKRTLGNTKKYGPDKFGNIGSVFLEYELGALEQYTEEFQEDIEKMAEKEMIDIDKEDGSTYIKTTGEETLEGKAEFKYSVDRILPDKLEVEASYQQERSGVASNDALKEISDALDPMKFDSGSYEDIEVEIDFQYSATTNPSESRPSAALKGV